MVEPPVHEGVEAAVAAGRDEEEVLEEGVHLHGAVLGGQSCYEQTLFFSPQHVCCQTLFYY